MIAIKLTQVGNSVGAVFPKEALVKLDAQKGDVLYLTETSEGDLRLSKYDPDIAEEIAMGEAIMERYRDTLRALAK